VNASSVGTFRKSDYVSGDISPGVRAMSPARQDCAVTSWIVAAEIVEEEPNVRSCTWYTYPTARERQSKADHSPTVQQFSKLEFHHGERT
jgi:hypothetical protein